MGRDWKDVLEEMRMDPAEGDKIALRKIAAAEEELAGMGRDFASLSEEEAAGLLERMDISPDQFERIVSTYGTDDETPEAATAEEEPAAAAEEEPAAAKEPAAAVADPAAAKPAPAAEEEDAPTVTEEERNAFLATWENRTKDEWDTFVDSLETQEQVDQVYELLGLDAEKTAELVAVEDAAYHGVMRAYAELNKVAEAEAAPAELSTFEQIMAAADAATRKVEAETK